MHAKDTNYLQTFRACNQRFIVLYVLNKQCCFMQTHRNSTLVNTKLSSLLANFLARFKTLLTTLLKRY